MHSGLQQSIIRTLAWFDLFSYPLTAQEVYQYLWEPPTNVTFEHVLAALEEGDQIETAQGFYFLPGRSDTVRQRQLGVQEVHKKLKIAARACKRIRWIPFVRAVFVCNTVAASTASKESDIDVFVVIRQGRMWLTRLFLTGILSLFRMRRHGECVANKICLSFFVTDDALNLSSIRWGSPDIYLAYWLSQLIPVFDPDDVLQTIHHKNVWIRSHLPHAFGSYTPGNEYRVGETGISRTIKKVLQKVWGGQYGNLIEQQAKHIQELKMKRNYDSVKDAEDSRVVITDRMLKFHENDRRAQYRDQWQRTLADEPLV